MVIKHIEKCTLKIKYISYCSDCIPLDSIGLVDLLSQNSVFLIQHKIFYYLNLKGLIFSQRVKTSRTKKKWLNKVNSGLKAELLIKYIKIKFSSFEN